MSNLSGIRSEVKTGTIQFSALIALRFGGNGTGLDLSALSSTELMFNNAGILE
jgi:hypothetical protein